MDSDEVKEKISKLSVWKNGDQRAPHKPLLILYALSQIQSDKPRLLPYNLVRGPMIELLKEFGPSRRSYCPEEPFARLVNDGIWELSTNINKTDINNSFLKRNDVKGGFTKDIYSLLNKNHSLIQEITKIILDKHFPETIHNDIIQAIGLDVNIEISKIRNPLFREKILKAYEYKCAICGFNVRLGHNLIAVEAAHIKWHQVGGPDCENNGIALCSLHHKLFDRGVFTLSDNRQLLVAENAHGTNGFNEWLMRYHGKEINQPIDPGYAPKEQFVNWHVKEVFKGPARYKIG